MAGQDISYQNVVDLLVQKVPELRPLLDSHLRDQFGELLPHVFFGDLTRYVMAQMRRPDTDQDAADVVARISNFLEEAMSSLDDKLQELVSVSFLENLDPSDKTYEKVKSKLGTNLRRELRKHET